MHSPRYRHQAVDDFDLPPRYESRRDFYDDRYPPSVDFEDKRGFDHFDPRDDRRGFDHFDPRDGFDDRRYPVYDDFGDRRDHNNSFDRYDNRNNYHQRSTSPFRHRHYDEPRRGPEQTDADIRRHVSLRIQEP